MARDGYLGNRRLKPTDSKTSWTEDQIEEYKKCITDPVYFIKKYVKIISLDKGEIHFDLWDYQIELINSILENRYVIAKCPRQSGKTQCMAALLLWYCLFNENYSIVVLAHKERQAIEILSRIKYSYEFLPKWLQHGIVEWNKKDIELENGSKISAAATAASGVRGESRNFVYLDEFAHVENNVQEDFFTSTYPVITSGTTTKLIITSTPRGMDLFYKIWTESEEGRNAYKRIDVHWSQVPGRDETWKNETISNTSERQFSQEFCCEFLGSTNTLIDSKKLKQLAWREPIERHDNLSLYENPIPNHSYIIIVDVSRGVSIDYSAFIVVDITSIPYKIVGTYYDNEISPLLYPNIIYRTGMYYNNALVLIEVNDNGQQIADILFYDLEYDGVILTQTQGRSGVKVGGSHKVKPIRGVRTTKQVKRIGCANLKTLIESDKLIFDDYNLIYELFRFVENKASYEAEEGSHDDLVMCCVLFAWLVNQSYFKNKSGTDVRDDLWMDNKNIIESSITPFGFIDNNSLTEPDHVTQDEFYNLDVHPSWFDPEDAYPHSDNNFF